MKGVRVVVGASCLVGDLVVSCFLGEFSFDSFLLNSFVGEKFLSLVSICCPKVSSALLKSTF